MEGSGVVSHQWNRLLEAIRLRLQLLRLRRKYRRQTDPSQLGEARILGFILKCLKNQGHVIPKTFLELGANSPYELSNTWYLEKTLGFSGVAIDPLPLSQLAAKAYALHRPKTTFINKAFLPSTYEGDKIIFYESSCDVLSTTDKEEMATMSSMGIDFSPVETGVVRLHDINQYFPDRIGIMFLDIESFALQVEILKEVTSTKRSPWIICVETLDFSADSKSLRVAYDEILAHTHYYAAGTYLNCIYLCNSLGIEESPHHKPMSTQISSDCSL